MTLNDRKENYLPEMELIEAIDKGNITACQSAVNSFQGYIASSCMRESFDIEGKPFRQIDECMKDYVEQKLLIALYTQYHIISNQRMAHNH